MAVLNVQNDCWIVIRPTDDWGFSTVEYGINNQVSLGAELDGVSYELIWKPIRILNQPL